MKHDRDHAAGAFHHHQRVESAILEELRSIVSDDLVDPELEGVQITGLVLSVDNRNARVHFAVPRGRPRTACERAFERAAPYMRGRLAESVEMKRTPELRFVYDAELAG